LAALGSWGAEAYLENGCTLKTGHVLAKIQFGPDGIDSVILNSSLGRVNVLLRNSSI
jgi:hypothetical protein